MVLKQKWVLFDDWYIHPRFSTMYLDELPFFVAHKCDNGDIMGIIGPGCHKSKKYGLIKLYGRCRKCKKSLNSADKLHAVINLMAL